MKQIKYIISLFLLLHISTMFYAQDISNFGKLSIKSSTLVSIPGGFTINNGAETENNGLIEINGDWINNGSYSDTAGIVKLTGGDQNIGGSSISAFTNLSLLGTGIKSMSINTEVKGNLLLNDRELAAGANTISVLSSSSAAVSYSGGFISSLAGGGLERQTMSTGVYTFPLGSSLVTNRYRPVDVIPGNSLVNKYKIGFINSNATTDGFDVAVKDSSLSWINPEFYHVVERTAGSDSADLNFYFDNMLDGSFDALAQWQGLPQWENTGNSSFTYNASPVLSVASLAAWSDLSASPVGLAKLPGDVVLSSSDSVICSGESILFTATYGFDNYAFYINSVVMQNIAVNSLNTANVTDGDTVFVVATDSTGGSAISNEIIITVNANPQTNISPDTTEVCAGSVLSLNGNPSGGSGSYITEVWTGDVAPLSSSSIPNPDFLTSTSGSYNLSFLVTDDNTCSASDSITITVYALPVIDAGSDTSICEGSTVTLAATGAAEYIWSTAETTGSIDVSPLTTTSYYISGTDGNSCINFDSVLIAVNQNPLIDLGEDLMVCAGGSIILDAGTGYDSYLWSDGSTTQTISVTSSDSYIVTVSTSSCSNSDTVNVTVSPSSIVTTITGTDASCSGVNDGAASIVASGGTTPYAYLWSNGSTGTIISNLAPGMHFLTVTDANGCYVFDSISIGISGAILNSTISSNDVSCQASNDGSAILSASGGAEPYSYLWSNGETTAVVTNFGIGTYYVTVSDTNGCNIIDSTTINFTGDAIVSSIMGTDASCSSTADGAASLSVSGGSSPYSQLWSNGSTASIITNLLTGNYSVTITDASGCTVNDNIIIDITGSVIGLNLDGNNVSCGDASDGAAGVIVSGGVTPYTYSWSTGSTSSIITDIPADIYSVTVTDATGCTNSDAITIAEEITDFTIDITTTDASCGQNDGSASISVSGGTAPYSYDWSSGNKESIADSLMACIYMVTVTDANGCNDFAVVSISDETGAELALNNITNVSCYGSHDGAIDISVSGGTMPYSFNWSNGATIEDISNLSAGPYEITLMDADNCISSSSITITQPAGFTVLSTPTDATCNTSDGVAQIDVSGGTTPYSYLWGTGGTTNTESGLPSGVYDVLVTDAQGCNVSANVAISDIGSASIGLDMVSDASCGGGGGSIFISITGGSPPYIYSWSDGTNSQDLIGVNPGTYSVSVTGSDGCHSMMSVTVDGDLPEVNPICLVTVDSVTGNNQVMWEKVQQTGIESYNIYKESTTAGLYTLVGNVPFDDMSIFTDDVSNPLVKSWRYKITAVDTCGNESDYSSVHKTIHLTINQGTGSNWNLIWDGYQGFYFGTYYIHRYTQTSGWELIDSVASTAFSYTDINAPLGSITYQITVKKEDDCYPSSSDKTQSGPYNQSFSNLDDNGIQNGISVYKDSGHNVYIYPNPNKGIFTVLTETDNQKSITIEISNISGQLLKRLNVPSANYHSITNIDLSGHSKGVYFVKVYGDKFSRVEKVILN